MSTTGRKTAKERGLQSVEAGPDDPIYKRNWIIGSRSSTSSSKGTQKSQKDDKEAPAKG